MTDSGRIPAPKELDLSNGQTQHANWNRFKK